MSVKKELILCFDKKQALMLCDEVEGDAVKFLEESASLDQYFIPRYIAETSETLIHPIPYFIVADESNNVLLYQRGKGVGESRLLGKHSVGFGGHVELLKDCLVGGGWLGAKVGLERIQDSIWRAVCNESSEELDLLLASPGESNFHLLDIIYDSSDEVGKRHLGVALIIRVESASIMEDELVDCGWHSVDELLGMHEIGEISLENWSVLALDML